MKRNIERIRKSFLSLICIIGIFFLVGSTSNAMEMEKYISTEDACTIAAEHIKSMLLLSENETYGEWRWGIRLGTPIEMYDVNDCVNSYYIQVFDKSNMPAGYVVIGATREYAPVIEFSTSGSFYATQNGVRNNKAVYYDGGIDYYYKNNDTFSSIITNDSDVKLSSSGQLRTSEVNAEIYSKEWEIWEGLLATSAQRSSNPPTDGSTVITKPSNYESGYTELLEDAVPNSNLSYKITSNFSGYHDHCTPTAATNIMFYWYSRNSSTYSSLRKNNSWTSTFAELYSLLKTNQGADNGTYPSNYVNGYSTYFSNAGFSNAQVYYYPSAYWSNIKNEISADYPFQLDVVSHHLYNTHSVVAIGYKQFKYNASTYSRYIQIADGWSSSSSRYVHTSDGVGSLRMVRTRPQ